MKTLHVLSIGLAVLVGGPLASENEQSGRHDRFGHRLHARLIGYDEVPAVSTPAKGAWKARVKDGTIEYELSYMDLDGDITQSHIHFGKPGTNGGIAVWLCGTATNPGPAGTPMCEGLRTGGASGVITAAQVIGPAGQGIAETEFEEVVAAIRAGATYVNVHSTLRPGGEIRGLVR